jgi:hypothetical protein
MESFHRRILMASYVVRCDAGFKVVRGNLLCLHKKPSLLLGNGLPLRVTSLRHKASQQGFYPSKEDKPDACFVTVESHPKVSHTDGGCHFETFVEFKVPGPSFHETHEMLAKALGGPAGGDVASRETGTSERSRRLPV